MVVMKNKNAPKPLLAAFLLQLQWLPLSLLLFNLLPLSDASIGRATRYDAPYIPTACYGSDTSEFPANNHFAAAGEGLWDNGAACGRQYLVRCRSGPPPSSCIPGSTIQVKIVDRAATAVSHPSGPGAALFLSSTAYSQLVNPPSAAFINIEYQQSTRFASPIDNIKQTLGKPQWIGLYEFQLLDAGPRSYSIFKQRVPNILPKITAPR